MQDAVMSTSNGESSVVSPESQRRNVSRIATAASMPTPKTKTFSASIKVGHYQVNIIILSFDVFRPSC